VSVRVEHGDCREVIGRLAGEGVVVDAIITDPPYGLTGAAARAGKPLRVNTPMARMLKGFMGTTWDGTGIAFEPEIWATVLSVLRPGGYLLAFGGCYDEKTEVLTSRGWVSFPDVKRDDTFASLDPITEKVEFQLPTEIVRFVHDGPMHRYKNNRVDLIVTPSHKMFVAPLGCNPKGLWNLVESNNVPPASRMSKTSTGLINGKSETFVLPGVLRGKGHGHYEQMPDVEIPGDVWAAFLGIYLAEGHASKCRGYSSHVALTHFNAENVREMADLLSPYFKVRLYPASGRLRINDPRLYEHLAPLGQAPTKRLPPYVKRWAPTLLLTLLDWYARGDGDASGRIYTASPALADDIQEIAMYAGLAADVSVKPRKNGRINGREIIARHPQYVIRLLRAQIRPEVYVRRGALPVKSEISREEWNRCTVYCVELPRHHTLYVRRNGKAVWCGNTRTQHRMVCAIEDAGFVIQDNILGLMAADTRWNSFVSTLDAEQQAALIECIGDTGFAGLLAWTFGTGFPKGRMQLKPAHEPICMAYRPGAPRVLGVDECRIGTDAGWSYPNGRGGEGWHGRDSLSKNIHEPMKSEAGRWPANVTHDGSAEVMEAFAAFGEKTSGTGAVKRESGAGYKPNALGTESRSAGTRMIDHGGDTGTAARFFYTAKADKQDRWGSRHPTVKPVELIRYLVKLVCPAGGTFLDPFAGSGTAGVAALAEGRNAILIEQDAGYIADIRERMAHYEGEGRHSLVAKNRHAVEKTGALL
jgi:DNA methylase